MLLTDPLDGEQRLLLETVWKVFAEHGRFPNYQYVEYVLYKEQVDAQAVLRGLPVAQGPFQSAYRMVGAESSGGFIQPHAAVWLTIGALHHLDDEKARAVCDLLLACMRAVTLAREGILKDPFGTFEVRAQLKDVLAVHPAPSDVVDRVVKIGQQGEWPGLRVDPAAGAFYLRPGALTNADFASTGDYLAAVTAAAVPPWTPTPLSYTDARALPRAFTVLEITAELVLNRPGFVARPPMDRAVILAEPVTDADGFHHALTVLTDVLGSFQVPGKNPPHALGRLHAWLTGELPNADKEALQRAIDVLDAVREIRNNGTHYTKKPKPELLKAHHRLEVPLQITDHAQAWDSIRARATEALTALHEEIYAARPPAAPTQAP
ncbi:hypothetical protein ACFV6F_38610 [Kitasatospora phosalacinea]|uniref:hypothetical protein n=1 Tax=Kitasatospora phosalacinea TaxID=2065 RepID=UPI003655A20E